MSLPPYPRFTPENARALSLIDSYIRARGSGPTVRELAALMGLRAHSGAHRHLVHLQELELIRVQRTGGRRQVAAHTVRLTAAGRRVLERRRRNEL